MKSPIVHFAILGLGLFVGAHWFFPEELAEQVPDTRVVVSQSRVAVLIGQYEARTGTVATDGARSELIQRFAEEEMLCREAQRWGLTEDNQAVDLRLRQKMAFISDEEHSDEELERQAKALGLDSDDAVIRNMLVHNMRLLLSTRGERDPTDDEVEAFYERERSRFAQPARITGWHVFFAQDPGQSSVMAAAHAAKGEIEAESLEPEQAVELGDAFPAGAHFRGKLTRQLASRYGKEFANAAENLPEGRWSDPIETPFGAHLLLVEERTEPETPALSEIRARVAAVYKSNQRKERLATAMEELRARYEVVVE